MSLSPDPPAGRTGEPARRRGAIGRDAGSPAWRPAIASLRPRRAAGQSLVAVASMVGIGWVAAWTWTASGQVPTEEPSLGHDTVFVESAQSAGLDFVHFNGMVGKLYFAENMGSGAAVFDYDGDGDLDIYLGQGQLFEGDALEQAVFQPKHPLPLTGRLYRNDLERLPDGTRRLRFVDVTERAGFAPTAYTMGVCTGDYDNDGDVDLYLANLGSNALLRNDGDGTFTDVIAESGADDRSWSVACSFFDYDRDGWLDLVVGNYVEWRVALHKDCTAAMVGTSDYCGPLAFRLTPNSLFRNRGDGTFENVTERVLRDQRPASTLGTVAGDFDDDGWLDLYVANDLVENQMWMNRAGSTAGERDLIDHAVLGGTSVDAQGQPQASMGVVAGDLDADGDEDLFMTHLRLEMNTLYLNDGSGLFRDASRESGLGRPSWSTTGFGVALLDYDNDGVLDLYVANGSVKLIEEQVRAGERHPLREPNALYRGLGGGRFAEVPESLRERPAYSEVSRGVAAGDLDGDGDVDLIVTNNAGRARLLRNEVGQDRPWLGLRLLLRDAPRDAYGAKVGLFRRGRPTQWRRVRTDGSYASASDPRVLFGLGDGGLGDPGPGEIEKVWVRWPDGSVEVLGPDQVTVGAYTTVRQGDDRIRRPPG
ncbi:MAG TPA: CRTAC1 family protein [Thermoanaerobaculia bacterium]|nr:CRTAC1 family protein [Thermoanaerobaculia bacterium]